MSGEDSLQTKRRGRFLRYAPLIFWIGLIFLFSTTQGSMSNTSLFIRPFLKFLFPGASEDLITIYHGFVRKSAHLIAYAILSFWAWRAFLGSSAKIVQKYWYLLAFAVVLATASIDELNQSFNSARTGSVNDVLLDSCGGLVMLLIIYLCIYFTSRRTV